MEGAIRLQRDLKGSVVTISITLGILVFDGRHAIPILGALEKQGLDQRTFRFTTVALTDIDSPGMTGRIAQKNSTVRCTGYFAQIGPIAVLLGLNWCGGMKAFQFRSLHPD